MLEKEGDCSQDMINERPALTSHGYLQNFEQNKKYSHCKKSWHIVDYCWQLHPKKRNIRGFQYHPQFNKKATTMVSKVPDSGDDEKKRAAPDQNKELQAYLSKLDSNSIPEETVKVNKVLAILSALGICRKENGLLMLMHQIICQVTPNYFVNINSSLKEIGLI